VHGNDVRFSQARAEALALAIRPWNYFRRIPTYMIMVPERHRQTGRTDRHTDRRTIYCGITALCVA